MQGDTKFPQEHEASLPHRSDYTNSVDDIRIKLNEIGISKSKDTIQRYCREGSLDCQKLGMFKRYFATEKSVEKLIEKTKTDASATNCVKAYSGAKIKLENDLPLHAAAADNNFPKNNDLHAGVSGSSQMHEDVRTNTIADTPETNSGGDKIHEMLQRQVDDKDKTIEFLQGELVARRGAVSALEKIIDAFGDNAQASLLSAKNEKQRMTHARENQKGSEQAEIIREFRSVEKQNINPTG